MVGNKDYDDLRKRIAGIRDSDGHLVFSVERVKNGHYRVTNLGTGNFMSLPGTPSDWRSFQNSLRDLRGIGFTREMYERPERFNGRGKKMDTETRNMVQEAAQMDVPDLASLTTYEAAHFAWKWLRAIEVVRAGVVNSAYHNGVLGYTWKGRLPNVLEEIWPVIKGMSTKDRRTVELRIISAMRDRGIHTIKTGNPYVLSTYHIWTEWSGNRPARNELPVLADLGDGGTTSVPAPEPAPKPVTVAQSHEEYLDAGGAAPKATEEVADPAEDVLFKAALEVRELRAMREKVDGWIGEINGIKVRMQALTQELKALLEDMQ